MSPLRQKMIDAMRQRGFSINTHESYLRVIADLARFHHRSPDELSTADLQRYFDYLARERTLAPSSCRVYLAAVRFLFVQVLGHPLLDCKMVVPKKPERIPELLSATEVGRIIGATANPKHQAMLCTCYGCGLRVSELVGLLVRHVDGERRVLRVEQGKGAKDRHVAISAAMLTHLRSYWRQCRPREWLFPNRYADGPLHRKTAQLVFLKCKQTAGIEKVGGIHALRHAYATHQLEAGLPVHKLQYYLGHRRLETTMRYVHWVSDYQASENQYADLVAELELAP